MWFGSSPSCEKELPRCSRVFTDSDVNFWEGPCCAPAFSLPSQEGTALRVQTNSPAGPSCRHKPERPIERAVSVKASSNSANTGLSHVLEPAQGSKVACGRLLLLPVTKEGPVLELRK